MPPVDIQTFELDSGIDFILVPSEEIRNTFESIDMVKHSWNVVSRSNKLNIDAHDMMQKVINSIIEKKASASTEVNCSIIALSLINLTSLKNTKRRKSSSGKRQKQFKGSFKSVIKSSHSPMVNPNQKYITGYKKKSYSEKKSQEFHQIKMLSSQERRRRNLTIDVDPVSSLKKTSSSPKIISQEPKKKTSHRKKRSHKRTFSEIGSLVKMSESAKKVMSGYEQKLSEFEKMKHDLELLKKNEAFGRRVEDRDMNDHVLIVDEGDGY